MGEWERGPMKDADGDGRLPPWRVVASGHFVQLSAVDPPDARLPGPVVGPGSRVRVRARHGADPLHRVVCLDVEGDDGTIAQGYTYAHLVKLQPTPGGWRSLIRRLLPI